MTNDNKGLTLSSMSQSILEDLLTPIIHETVASSILNEQVLRRDYGTMKNPKIINYTNPLHNSNSEDGNIFENSQLKKVKNGYGNSSNMSSASNSNNNSNRGTPPPPQSQVIGSQVQPDLGRIKFIYNGKDIYSNKTLNGNSSLGNGSSMNGTNGNSSNGGSNGDSRPMTSNGSTNGTNDSDSEYFKCLNCDRKIAGSRFAAHIDRCLGGRQRK